MGHNSDGGQIVHALHWFLCMTEQISAIRLHWLNPSTTNHQDNVSLEHVSSRFLVSMYFIGVHVSHQ
jgi:hypothetical protein